PVGCGLGYCWLAWRIRRGNRTDLTVKNQQSVWIVSRGLASFSASARWRKTFTRGSADSSAEQQRGTAPKRSASRTAASPATDRPIMAGNLRSGVIFSRGISQHDLSLAGKFLAEFGHFGRSHGLAVALGPDCCGNTAGGIPRPGKKTSS